MPSSVLGVCLLKFSIDLYAQLHTEKKEENIVFSPFSIGSALSMVLAGTRGDTAKQLSAVLHVSEGDNLHEQYSQLMAQLSHYGHANVSFQVANRMYSEHQFKLQKEFVSLLEKYYKASIKSVDFINNYEAVRTEANKWISEQTNSKIKELIPEGALSSLTMLLILNAIYFKGTWDSQFPKDLTELAPFHLNSKKSVQVFMMHQNPQSFAMGHSTELKAKLLKIPYVGKKCSMVILLPDDVEGLSFLEEKLSESTLSSALGSLAMTNDVELTLPKFKFESPTLLRRTLDALGAKDLFSTERANISGIFENGRPSVSDVIHKAFLEVDEASTEAAASTAVNVMTSGVYRKPTPTTPFVVDHPFMFLIKSEEDNVIFFMGSVRKLEGV